MLARRRLMVLGAATLAMLALGFPVQAAEPSAKEFVASVYKHYQGRDPKGIPIDSALAKSILTPGLLALIEADAKRAARRKEVPRLDGDPFINAQDFDDIGPVTIDVTEKGDTAIAKAGFKIFDEKRTVTLSLVKTGGTWRIDDFVAPIGLRKMLGGKK
jgi:hypothetical protein